jgi:hypothetical protein
MIETKAAPHIFMNKELIANAFMGLESKVCDLKNMSIIAELAIENSWQIDKRVDGSGDIQMRLSEGEFNSIQFAVMHLADMIRKFQDDYYECFHADRGAAA